jgi:hypothetical protein
MANEAGQPFVHFRHWKHSAALNGPAASALSRKLKSGLKLDCCIALNYLRLIYWEKKESAHATLFHPESGKAQRTHLLKKSF